MSTETKCCFCGAPIEVPVQSLKLLHRSVCICCEQQVSNLTVNDELYGYYQERIKRMWFAV